MKRFKDFIIEVKKTDKGFFVVYSGRFQPFTSNHYMVYEHLVKKFGKNNVYIGTSSKKEPGKSPFHIREKVDIINTMFDIPKDKIIFTMWPYDPKTWDKRFLSSHENDSYISAVGKKDLTRLDANEYFEEYDDSKELEPWKNKGYYYIAPMQNLKFEGKLISGTSVRDIFKSDDEELKKKLFKFLYKKMDDRIYKLLSDKIGSM